MVEIDGLLLNMEIELLLALATQVALAVVAGVVGYIGGRFGCRMLNWIGFVCLLTLAVVTCYRTVNLCQQGRATIHGRMEGRIIGPHLSSEKANNALGMLTRYSVLSLCLPIGTLGASRMLWRVGQRHRMGQTELSGI